MLPRNASIAQWQSTGLVNQGSGVRSSLEAFQSVTFFLLFFLLVLLGWEFDSSGGKPFFFHFYYIRVSFILTSSSASGPAQFPCLFLMAELQSRCNAICIGQCLTFFQLKWQKLILNILLSSLDSSPLNSGPGIYCWRVGGQLIYYLPYFISLNVKTVIVI